MAEESLRKYPLKKPRLKSTTWCKQKCKEPQLNTHSRHAHKWRSSSRNIHKWRSLVRWFVYMHCCRKHWALLPVCCLHHIISWIMWICFCFSIVLRRILDLFWMNFGSFFWSKGTILMKVRRRFVACLHETFNGVVKVLWKFCVNVQFISGKAFTTPSKLSGSFQSRLQISLKFAIKLHSTSSRHLGFPNIVNNFGNTCIAQETQ